MKGSVAITFFEVALSFLACFLVFDYGASLSFLAFAAVLSIAVVYLTRVLLTESQIKYKISFPSYIFTFLPIILVLFLAVPNLAQPVIPNSQIPVYLLVRAVLWMPVSLLVPGLFLLSILRVNHMLRSYERLALGFSLSIAVLGLLAALIRTIAPNDDIILSIAILLMTMYLVAYGSKRHKSVEIHFGRNEIMVLLLFISVICASATVQVVQGYLVGGDLWRNVRIGLYLDSRKDALVLFENPETIGTYPTFIGYLITAFSQISGLPAVNAYVASFFMVGVSGIALYSIFNRLLQNKKVSLLGAFFASLGGGLGWVVAIAKGLMPEVWAFWVASYVSQDMYFSENFTANLLQGTGAVGLLLALSAVLIVLIYIKEADRKHGFFLLIIAGLLLAASFLTHWIEFLLITPLILLLYILTRRGREAIAIFASCLIFVMAFGFFNDFYEIRYSFLRVLWLAAIKGFTLSMLEIVIILVSVFGIVVLLLAVGLAAKKMNCHRSISNPIAHLANRTRSTLYIYFCLAVWVSLIILWGILGVPQLAYGFGVGYPLWVYSIAFGVIGILGVIGLREISFRDKINQSIICWMVFSLLAATFVWGQRAAEILFIPLAFFASIELVHWAKTRHGLHKAIVSSVILIIILSSCVSYVFTVRYFSRESSASDDLASIARWIFINAPSNVSIFSSPPSNDFIATIALRPVFPRSEPANDVAESLTDYNTLIQSSNSQEVASILNKWKIEYALFDPTDQVSWPKFSYFEHLLNISEVLVRSGEMRLLELPRLKNPEEIRNLQVFPPAELALRDLYFMLNDALVLQGQNLEDVWSDSELEKWAVQQEATVGFVRSSNTSSMTVTPQDNESHWFSVGRSLPENLTGLNYLLISHFVNNSEVYQLMITIVDVNDNALAHIYFDHPSNMTTEVYVLDSGTTQKAASISLTIWTVHPGIYCWYVQSIAFAQVIELP